MAKKKLSEYRAKRDFTKTAEPSGAADVRPAKYLRFVIQKHDASHLHYDLRLELDGVFKSWAVTRGPSIDPKDKRLAVEVEDHPLDYGDFEGTIPKGQYGGGTVMLWDRGFWAPVGDQSPEEQLRKGELKFILAGDKLKGSWVLVKIKNDRFGESATTGSSSSIAMRGPIRAMPTRSLRRIARSLRNARWRRSRLDRARARSLSSRGGGRLRSRTLSGIPISQTTIPSLNPVRRQRNR